MPNNHPHFRPVRQMLDTICNLPLTSDVFAQSIHPTSPIIALGLASGHVQIHRLPPCRTNHGSPEPAAGHDTIDTIWRTHRHKGSCRSLSFSPDGLFLFSAGMNGIVKAAAGETGRVVSKIAVPVYSHGTDPPTLIHTLSPQSLLVATDSSALHIYDLRTPAIFSSQRPHKTHNPHDDYISSLSPLASSESSTSGFSKQWISTGGSSIAITDLRKGVMKAEDLGEELLSSVVLEGGKVIIGGERGILKIFESGKWQEGKKLVAKKGESLDILGSVPQSADGENKQKVAIGLGDGTIRIMSLLDKKLIGELRHDEVESVVGLGFEPEGRMISTGGSILKVWQENNIEDNLQNGTKADDDTESEKGEEDESSSEEEEEEEEEGEEKGRKRRKRRKRGKEKRGGSNGIMAFKGLD